MVFPVHWWYIAGRHTTGVGAKAEEVMHGVKAAIPGTTEHEATHGPTGTTNTGMGTSTGMGTHTATGTHTGMGTTGTTGVKHTAENPVTGEVHTHSTQTGAKLDQGWQDLKQKIPGTTEHRATHPTTGTTGRTGYDEPATRPL